VLFCIGLAAVAAGVCRQFSRIAAPFVGGVIGAFGILGALDTPYGGVLGLLIGFAVTLWPAPLVRRVEARPAEQSAAADRGNRS
jgi:hypothetical protein